MIIIKGEIALPFTGEPMLCDCCGSSDQSSPNEAKGWRVIEILGANYARVRFYLCPEELPEISASPEEFKAAYVEAFKLIVADHPRYFPARKLIIFREIDGRIEKNPL